MGFCNCSMFYCELLCAHSSFATILIGRRELVALPCLSSWCILIGMWLILAVPRVCLRFVIVVFPDYTHLLFFHSHPLNFELIHNLWQCPTFTTYEVPHLSSKHELANTRMELHITRAINQAKIWLQADHAMLYLRKNKLIDWLESRDELEISKWVWLENTTITYRRPTHGTVRKSHISLTVARYQTTS